MSGKATIKQAIEDKIGTSKYSVWRIGLTHDLAERKAHWRDTKKEDVSHWSSWTPDSLRDAMDIEAHFIAKGMKGGTGGDLSPQKTAYVYVY